jgi:transposase
LWKNKLKDQGPKIFFHLTPGRRKKEFSSFPEDEKLLIYETINRLLIEEKKTEKKRWQFSSTMKEELLIERERLKQEVGLSYERFSELVCLGSGSLRLWSRKVKKEGIEGLKNKSSAPKRRPKKLADQIIREIIRYGERWKRKQRKIRITEFSIFFRYKYRRLLMKFGKSNLSDKVIARYLKEAGLYPEKEERPKGLSRRECPRGKRGNFRYYFPGAQSLIDTTVIFFLGVKMKLVAVMDGFSRIVFHQEGFLRETSEKIIRCLNTSLKKAETLKLKVFSIISDHGKPYKSKRVKEFLKGNGVFRIFSAAYWPEGKAPLERYFRTLKETLSEKGKVVYLIPKGIFLLLVLNIVNGIKKKVAQGLFNLVLLGFTAQYNKTVQKGIDGKSPADRVIQQTSYQLQRATEKVLRDEERDTLLKNELIDSLYQEFGLNGEKTKVKEYLSRFRKETIKTAAEALRRKLVVAELAPQNRWWYLSKVAYIMEKKKREEEYLKAQQTIQREKQKMKEQQEIERIKEEKLWNERHPESALEKAVEWYVVLFGSDICRRYYEKEVIRLIEKILLRHSLFTSGKKIEKICERIKKKEMLTEVLKNKIEPNSKVPTSLEIEQAKEKIITLIKQHNFLEKQNIPAIQNLRRLWITQTILY